MERSRERVPPVVCSNKGQFAMVDHMEGTDTIKLNKDAKGLRSVELGDVCRRQGSHRSSRQPGDARVDDGGSNRQAPSMNSAESDELAAYTYRVRPSENRFLAHGPELNIETEGATMAVAIDALRTAVALKRQES